VGHGELDLAKANGSHVWLIGVESVDHPIVSAIVGRCRWRGVGELGPVNYNAKRETLDQIVGSKRTPRRLPSSLPATTRRPVSRDSAGGLLKERPFWPVSTRMWTHQMETVYWWAMTIAGLALIGLVFLT